MSVALSVVSSRTLDEIEADLREHVDALQLLGQKAAMHYVQIGQYLTEARDKLDDDDGRGALRESVGAARGIHGYLTSSIAIFLHYVFASRDHEMADFDLVRTGEDLKKGNPVLALRRRLVSERFKVKCGGGRLHRKFEIGLAIKAWNLWVEGKKITQLKYNYLKDPDSQGRLNRTAKRPSINSAKRLTIEGQR